MWSRVHLIPLLQAEEDRDLVRRHWADKERERRLLGTDTKVYFSDRYVWWPEASWCIGFVSESSGVDLGYSVPDAKACELWEVSADDGDRDTGLCVQHMP